MTTYAHHRATARIIASWPTGDGAVAHSVCRLPAGCPGPLARHLAQALTALSRLLWAAYGLSRAESPDPGRLEAILRRPNLPVGAMQRVADDDTEEAAHHLGRLLREVGGAACTEACVDEVVTECTAVRAATGGDLAGRARQAVVRFRDEALPGHRDRAERLLGEVPLGSERLFTDVEPTSAALEAIRWLAGAVAVVSRFGYRYPADVLDRAEVLDDRDLRVARAVLEHPAATPEEVVIDLLREASFAEAGYFVVCPSTALRDVLDGGGLSDPVRVEDCDRHLVVTTVLTPSEPGRCLVAGLLAGILGCFEVYLDEITTRERPDPDPRLTGPHWAEEVRQRFDDAVRDAVRFA